jgi:hypothetical protein
VTLRDQLSAGLVAGVAGGILIALFLMAAQAVGGGAFGTPAWLATWVAASLLGPSAWSNPGAPYIGIVLHFVVAIGWALGYVYLIRSQPQLLSHPWLSGASFGLVVYVFMQIALVADADWHRPSGPLVLAAGLVSHIVFYGIPVALLVSRSLRRA